MKLKFCFLLAAVVLLLAACNNKDASKFRVKTKYHVLKFNDNGHEQMQEDSLETFYYSADGKRDYKRNGINTEQKPHGKIMETRTYDKAGNLIGTTRTFLNKNGSEDSVIIKEGGKMTFAHKYCYDSAGFVIEDREYQAQPPMRISKYKVVDGNRVEETVISIPEVDTMLMPNPETGKMEKMIMYNDNVLLHTEFFLDKPNMPANENFGYTNKDIRSKNLAKKQVQLSQKGDTVDVYFFRYLFDDKGRVISAVQSARSGNEYDSTAYTYY